MFNDPRMFNHRKHDRMNPDADAFQRDPRQFAHRGGPRSPFDGEGPQGRPMFRGGPRGPRAKTGNLRLSVLALLNEGPRNGYQMIQEISERSGGLWQPSPGSMYPALSQLEDEGLIAVQAAGRQEGVWADRGGPAVRGRTHSDELKTPWDSKEGGRGGHVELRQGLHALMGAGDADCQRGQRGPASAGAGGLEGRPQGAVSPAGRRRRHQRLNSQRKQDVIRIPVNPSGNNC